jgi:hypothetical protein
MDQPLAHMHLKAAAHTRTGRPVARRWTLLSGLGFPGTAAQRPSYPGALFCLATPHASRNIPSRTDHLIVSLAENWWRFLANSPSLVGISS